MFKRTVYVHYPKVKIEFLKVLDVELVRFKEIKIKKKIGWIYIVSPTPPLCDCGFHVSDSHQRQKGRVGFKWLSSGLLTWVRLVDAADTWA